MSEFTSLSGLSKFQFCAITVENTHYKVLKLQVMCTFANIQTATAKKDTKIFYKLSNNKSASLIWVYFILYRL